MDILNFFLICVFILIIAYIKNDTSKRITAIDTFTKNSLAPDNVTVTRFRADLNSILAYISPDSQTGNMVFRNGASSVALSTKMVISPVGFVGVGTTSPQSLIHVAGQTDGEGKIIVEGGTTDSQGNRGTVELRGRGVFDQDYIGIIGAKRPTPGQPGKYGISGDSYFNSCIGFHASERTPLAGTLEQHTGSYISMETTPANSASRIERMRIEDGGNISIGRLLNFYEWGNVGKVVDSVDQYRKGYIWATPEFMQINTRSPEMQLAINNHNTIFIREKGFLGIPITNGTQSGTLSINASGRLVYTPESGTPATL